MDAQEGFIATTAMYEGLVRYKSGATDIEPALAEAWDISPDGVQYVFHLKPGVTFHDGSPLTAQGVAFSFNRSVNKDDPLYQDAQGDYRGFPYTRDYIANVVTKIEAVGDLDVRFTLNRKFSPLLSNLAIPAAYIQSMEALKKYGKAINENPVGTGPFKFVEWKTDDHITVDAFDSYWGGRPRLQRIVFQPVPEPSVRVLKVQNGEADVTWAVDPKDVPALKGQANTDVFEQPGLNVNMAEVNQMMSQLQSKALRQAMNYAIDRQELADSLIMRGMDVVLAFPYILLAIAVVAILGPGLRNAMIAIGIVYVPHYARIARGSGLSVRSREYVDAARAAWRERLAAHMPAHPAEHAGPADRADDPVCGHRHYRHGRPELSRARHKAAHARLGQHAVGRA